ncbi:hypothetical protein GQ457_15G000640 [Hibiscus cannabinus]
MQLTAPDSAPRLHQAYRASARTKLLAPWIRPAVDRRGPPLTGLGPLYAPSFGKVQYVDIRDGSFLNDTCGVRYWYS